MNFPTTTQVRQFWYLSDQATTQKAVIPGMGREYLFISIHCTCTKAKKQQCFILRSWMAQDRKLHHHTQLWHRAWFLHLVHTEAIAWSASTVLYMLNCFQLYLIIIFLSMTMSTSFMFFPYISTVFGSDNK